MATLLNTYYTYYNGSGNNSPLSGGDWRCYFKVYLDSQDVAGNYSAMHVDTYIQFANQPSGATSRSWIYQNTIDGTMHGNTMPTGYNQTPNDWLVYAPPAGNSTKYLATEYMNVYHGSDGTKNVSMYFKGGRWANVSGIPTYYVMSSGTWYYNLPTIPRYAAITSFNANVNSPTNVACSWSTDKTVSAVYYSTDGGSNWSASVGSGTSGTFNISGLATNTTYNIMLKVTAGDSGLQTTSGSLYRTTWYLSTSAFSNFNLGTNFTANVTRADGSITHNLEVYCKDPSAGSYTLIKTYYDVTTSQEISFISGELATIYALVPNRNDVAISITTVTKIGGTVYGYTYSYQTCYVVDANPIFTDFAFEDTNAATLALTGDSSKFIRGYSNAQMTVSAANKAVAQKGATMSTYSFENAGLTTPTPKAYSAVASVVETLNGVLNANLVVRATDSRGNNTTKTKTIGTFINYTAPVVSTRTIYRTDNVDDETTLTFSGTYNDWSGLSVANTIYNAKYRYKEVGGAWSGYTNLTLATNASGAFTFNNKINGDLGASGFTTTKTFEIEITITDKLSSVVYSGLILNSAQPLLWKFKGLVSDTLKSILGIGRKPDTSLPNGSIHVAGDIKADGTIYGIVSGDTFPIGGMMPWTSDTIPENWLLCNGQAISRTTYNLLYAVIGTTYGAGDASTTFNVPDMRDYVPVGKSSTDANINALGEKYGAQTNILTLDHLPYDVVVSNGPAVSNGWCTGIWNNFTGAYSTNARGALGTHGQAHNNMQKSIATNYIIKAFQSSGVVATVVDNLTSTSATNALSANQGKVLNEKHNNESWTAPTLQNSWINYGGGFQTAGYYKHDGRVYLRGLIKSGTMTQLAFTLPAGYRPTATEIFAVLSNSAFGSVYVYADGNVTPIVGNNAAVCLDGISFRID